MANEVMKSVLHFRTTPALRKAIIAEANRLRVRPSEWIRVTLGRVLADSPADGNGQQAEGGQNGR